MARALSAGMQSAVVAADIKPFVLLRAFFDSGTLNIWTGYGNLVIDTVTYTGAGDLLTISPIRETIGLEATGCSITMSGAPGELLALAHNENYQDRILEIYLGMFDNSWQIIADPYLLFEGRMDVMVLDDSKDTSTIKLQVENILIDLTRPVILNYTPEDQALFYPGDTGFNLVAGLQEKELLLAG